MKKPDIPKNESSRQAALEEYEILDVKEQEEFDFLTQIAAEICGTKIALINFITNNRQWFLSHHGLGFRETPREVAFCAHAIIHPNEPFIVEDARKDERFADNPLVLDDPNITFYAGIPLVDKNGFALGTLCVVDTEPKTISEDQIQLLKKLSKQVVLLLELKKNILEKEKINIQFQDTLSQLNSSKKMQRQSSEKYSKIFQLLSEGVVIHEIGGNNKIIDCNEASARILGLTKRQLLGLDSYHPQWRAINEDGSPLNGEDHPAMITMKTGKPVRNKVMGVHKNDHELIWILVNSEPVFEENSHNLKSIVVSFTDFTEKKEAINQLKNNFSLLDKLSSQVPGMLYQYKIGIDGNSSFPFTSDHIQHIYELSAEDVKNDASAVIERIHPDDKERVIGSIMNSKETLNIWTDEYRVLLPQNGERWLKGIAQPEAMDDGSVLWHGYIYDITTNKSHQLETKRIKEQFELAVAGTNDGIWDWNIESNELFISKRWKEMLGYEDHELKNEFKTFVSLLHEEDMERVNQYIQDYMNGKIKDYSIEFRMIHKNSSYVWILAKGVALRREDGKTYRMAGSHSDITKKKEAELQLIQERTRLAGIIEGTNVGTWEWNVQTGETIFNERWAEIIGYTLSELSPVSIGTWMKYGHPDDLEESGKQLESHFQGKLDYYEFESRMLHKNGEWVWVLDRGQVATWTTDGKPLLMMGTHQDITERKQIEAQLKEAQLKAESANQAKSEFLANMSHEIRTPLNGVIGFTELLQKTKLDEIQKEYCDSANISGKALLGIINDILDFSKIEAGKLDLEIIETDVVALVEHSTDIIKFHAGQKGIELLLNIQPDLPNMAYLDPVRLNQVMVNLLSNAVKFTEKGEVEVQLSFEKIDNNKGNYKFSIRDTGIGITKEQQNKLFQAFSQADGSTTRKYGGTGLGLIISSLLVEKMGSKIEVESEWGKGSTFYFTLELESRIREPDESIKNNSHLPINNVLVIDDNAKNLRILKENFRYWGIECDDSDRGVSALKLMESNHYDLLIVDYHMPSMDGIEFISKVRENEKNGSRDIPIILLHSSSDDPYLRVQCKKLGVQFNLVKPVKANELYNYIRNIHNPEFSSKGVSEEREINQPKKTILEKNKYTVLVAEDVPLNLLLVKGILKKLRPDVKVLEAENGQIAWEIAKSESIDLILMDIQMPIMDGLEATKQIRNWETSQLGSKRLPIIALTAGVIKEEQENALHCGMDEFLTKPIDQNKLNECLLKYLAPIESSA